jgi:hypothetical protein
MSSDFLGWFMCPHANDFPAECFETLISVGITYTVGFDLGAPEVSVFFRPGGMKRAAVPKAAIDEDCDTATGKDDINYASRLGKKWHLQPIAQTLSM